jgi:photosynthetic reaction center H subunit
MSPVIVGNLDIAMLTFWAFCIFFAGLVFYLNKESRREGYPVEDEDTGAVWSQNIIDIGAPKSFLLPHGQGTTFAPPTTPRDPVIIAARRLWRGAGAPIEPIGNPLVDGIGPAAYAERARHPDLDWEGHPRVVPMRKLPGITVARQDADPRGFTILGADGKPAGKVVEMWVDRADRLVRYLETQLSSGRIILVPMTMAVVSRRKGVVEVDALNAAQFEGAPAIDAPDTITLYEEERVQAYFGGGYLYANPSRSEPLI